MSDRILNLIIRSFYKNSILINKILIVIDSILFTFAIFSFTTEYGKIADTLGAVGFRKWKAGKGRQQDWIKSNIY